MIKTIGMGNQCSNHAAKEQVARAHFKRKKPATPRCSKKIELTVKKFFNRLSRVAPCKNTTTIGAPWGIFLVKGQSNSMNDLGPRLRRQRHKHGLTLQELGADSGVSVGYLSQVERGNAIPTLGTLSQIAAALHVGVDYFIATPKPVDSLTRAGRRPHFSVSGSSIAYEQIGADFPGHELTSFILHVPPGYTSEEVSHEGEEMIYILDGAIAQVVDGIEHTMTTGDSLHYLGTSPHSWSNKSDAPARILWVGRMQYEKSGKAKSENGAQRGQPSAVSALAPSSAHSRAG
ncbi:helix-turn-helix domain-containing protein [Octadecabacter sp. R77987]|uniref:helix-turn-helix domain-containing protein n=1 Tax=Octadecabacter sp. R77987 TaxID=3093874 RepID=UPI00366E0BDA